jgi:integrase
MIEHWAKQRAERKSVLTTKQRQRGERRKVTRFGKAYTPSSVDSRIRKVCEKFDIEHWSMNQLRHLRAEEIEQSHGIEAAAAILGHKHIQTTRVYSRRNAALANKVAGEAG